MEQPLSLTQAQAETQRFMIRVYGWMCLALIITGFCASYTASSPALLELVAGNNVTFIALLIIEFLAVMFLATLIDRMSSLMATAVFITYSALNGLTFSVIFVTFTEASIANTFFITAGTFAAMSIYGLVTKSDLTRWGSLLIMMLMGLIICSLVNLFMHSETLYWITGYAGVLIFVGLTAYDTQKIKNMNIIGNEGTDEDKKEAIMGALTLYLDFINLFLKLIQLFGKRK